jgi:hypothetical protein
MFCNTGSAGDDDTALVTVNRPMGDTTTFVRQALHRAGWLNLHKNKHIWRIGGIIDGINNNLDRNLLARVTHLLQQSRHFDQTYAQDAIEPARIAHGGFFDPLAIQDPLGRVYRGGTSRDIQTPDAIREICDGLFPSRLDFVKVGQLVRATINA